MRAARIASLAAVLALVAAAPSFAQRITAPGTYSANAGVAPGLLPAEFDPGVADLGPDVYAGEFTITLNLDGTHFVQFKGERADGAKLLAQATFASDWGGVRLGPLVIGAESVENCITGIHVEKLLSGMINGVGTVNGEQHRYIAQFGPGGELKKELILPAPGPFN